MSTPLYLARHKLAEQIGGYGQFIATGGTTGSVICAAAFKSTELPSSALAYAWVYNPTSAYPKQQRVKKDGVAGGSGTLTLADVIGTAFGNGTVFEIHSRIPAARETADGFGQATTMGCLECLNAALRHIVIETTRPLSLVSGQQDYSLTDAWLGQRARLKDVQEPNVFGNGTRSTARTWNLQGGSGTRTLHFDEPYRFTSGAPTVDLVVERPAHTIMNVSGLGWVDSTVGYSTEADEADVEVDELVTVGLVFAYKTLRDARSGPQRARYDALYQSQIQEARQLARYDKTFEIDASVPGARAAAAPVPAAQAVA